MSGGVCWRLLSSVGISCSLERSRGCLGDVWLVSGGIWVVLMMNSFTPMSCQAECLCAPQKYTIYTILMEIGGTQMCLGVSGFSVVAVWSHNTILAILAQPSRLRTLVKKIQGFWHFWPFWNLGPSQTFLYHFRSSWTISDHLGPFQAALYNFKPYFIILDHIGLIRPYWPILDNFVPFQTILDHIEPSWTILAHSTISDNFRPFQTSSDHILTISWQFSAISW